MNRLLIDGPAANTVVKSDAAYYVIELIHGPQLLPLAAQTDDRPEPPLSRRKGQYELKEDGNYHWSGWLEDGKPATKTPGMERLIGAVREAKLQGRSFDQIAVGMEMAGVLYHELASLANGPISFTGWLSSIERGTLEIAGYRIVPSWGVLPPSFPKATSMTTSLVLPD